MKNFVFSLLLIIMANHICIGQDQKVEIHNLLHEYHKHIQTRDAQKTLDYVHPKLFEFTPRNAMEQVMKNMYDNKECSIAFQESEILNISDIHKEGVNGYSIIKYQFKMVMTFAEDNEATKKTIEIIKSQYGEDQLEHNEERRVITVLIENQMYAIQEPTTYKGWKVIENKPNMARILDSIVPLSAQKKLNPKVANND